MENQDIERLLRDPSKLKWACRRGMLELDVLLSNFLDRGFNDLSDGDKRIFIELLQLPDPDLFALLMQQSDPVDALQGQVILQIRKYARG